MVTELSEALPPPPPQRQLDVISVEGLEDVVDPESPDKGLLKSRDFPEFHGLEVTATDVKVVLFDANSMDSFAACFAARRRLGDRARYVGVDRSTTVEQLNQGELSVQVGGQVVAMLGVCWSLEAMHDLVVECGWLLIFETHTSVAQELQHFNYHNAVPVLELEMGAGALVWNFFCPGEPVPPLLRAIEDAELGRSVLRQASAFADGFEEAFGFSPPRGEIRAEHSAFEVVELLLDGGNGGRTTMERAIEAGRALAPLIREQCREVAARRAVRTMHAFPAWRCALANISSPFAGRIAEHLAEQLAAEGAESAAHRSFGATFEVRHRRIRVVLRSLPGGPDVSEIAARQDGSGRRTRAFFSIPVDEWEELWVQPEPILWNVSAASAQCLALKRGDLVTVARMGERFRDSPADEWSWGYKSDEPGAEGWIPTLAHSLFVATCNVPSAALGVRPLEEGDLIVAQGQRGDYVWGWLQRRGESQKGWFKRADGVLRRVHSTSVQALLAAARGA